MRRVSTPTRDDVVDAASRLARRLRPTPLVSSPALGPDVALKLETQQPTGSFKVRGALAALTRAAPGDRTVTASAGNHALGIAWAAATLGVEATVVCPRTASPAKLEALRRFPVEVVEHGSGYDEAEAHALSLPGRFVSAYNDPDVIAGQGSLALELLEELTPPLTVVCPVGGGGLAAGLGLVAASVPGVRVIGVQSEAFPAMRAALDAGAIVEVPERPSIADGLAGNLEPGSVTVELVRRHVERVVLVSEREIEEAMCFLAREHGLVVEGAGAAGAAAVLAGQVSRTGKVVVVISGRNVALDTFARVLAGSP